ncbi:transporter substrate-binding domain-containing protein [Helicobacter saguini]|uniref:Transporter substrate-binding domain-containing protein n=2 Tax=Helicobacter saguini TaxID=1548018 RepID=A0A347W7F0_9HELI|nr:cysteine ABC transporter substrate-binding protein [Helicobacter saguini]MWV61291.1 transporter substrate-binding domain-containing protein [Helicobacter saguini]MWV68040.1 transporter substrate-binding domain-containing protein [Helicobacter saguini]MWV70493.1 transporter substrate-binding domain-containing protein [Helicobacter saguini]MWV72397.1 transporter substrate-binding domain-containing protein [Helicobacter saguini]TLD91863.1 transporter substrate-binding domain-containing protein
MFITAFFTACGDSKDSKTESKAESKADNSLDEIKKRGIVKIGVFSDKPPFGFINEKGQNDGYDVYISRRIAKDLLGSEDKVEFVLVEAAARLEYLKANKVDIIMANFTQTPEREKVVDFAKPYMKVSLGVVSKNGEITDEAQLQGKTLIVNKGTTADMYFSKQTGINLLKFDQNTETFQAFLQGKGDALAHDSTLLFAWVKEHPDYKVGIAELGGIDKIAPAVKKSNKELLEWLNNEITTLQEQGFFKEAYEATLAPAFSSDITPEMVIY